MNLLLLLSALLSALTGAGGMRGGPVAQAVCARPIEVRVARMAAAVTAVRPVQALPALARMVRAIGVALGLPPAEPPFASRRRE